MATKHRRLLIINSKWFLILNLCLNFLSVFTFGQVNVSKLPPTEGLPYSDNAYKLMHNLTSQSVVSFAYGASNSTGFFIMTHPEKPYYCMLTAGHSIFGRANPSSVVKKDEQVTLNIIYRLLYTDVNSVNLPAGQPDNTNNISWVWPATPTPVTVAQAEYSSSNLLDGDSRDYALILVPKVYAPPIPIYLHGFSFMDVFNENRLNTERVKSAYNINNGLARPQLISTIKKEEYHEVDEPGDNRFSFQGLRPGLLAGASGSPLVVPKFQTYWGSAIGIFNGDLNGYQYFYKLERIRDLILDKCWNVEKEKGETVKSAFVVDKLQIKLGLKSVTDLSIKIVTDLNDANLNPLTNQITVTNAIKEVQNYKVKAEALTKDLDILSPEDIKKKIIELDATNLAVEDLLRNITIVRKTKPKDSPSYTWSFLGLIGYPIALITSTYFSSDNDNSIYAIKASENSTANSMFILRKQLESDQGALDLLVNSGKTELKRKKVSGQSGLMHAPDQLITLHNAVLDAARLINKNFLDQKNYKSTNEEEFQGLEYYYEHQEENSNRYLLPGYYNEEYSITEFIVDAIETEINNAKPYPGLSQFVTDCTVKLEAIKTALKQLRKKAYPKGFISVSPVDQPLGYKYYNFKDDNKKYEIKVNTPNLSEQTISWPDLDLKSETNSNSFKYKDITAGPTVNRIDGPIIGASYNGNKKTVNEVILYSTKFKLIATFPPDNVKYNVDKYLQQFLDANALKLKTSGELISKNKKESISVSNILDRSKEPFNAMFRAHFIDFIQPPQTVVPNIISTVSTGTFELNSPEILVLSRSFSKTDVGDGTGYITEELLETNSQLGQSLVIMKKFVDNSVNYRYSVKLNEYFDVNFDLKLPSSLSVLPGQYRIKSRTAQQYIRELRSPYIFRLDPFIKNLKDQMWNVSLNDDGLTYSIRSAYAERSSLVLDLSGNYTEDGAGFMLTLNIPNNGTGQKWTITPSTTDGFYTINDVQSSTTPWFMTAKYEERYARNVVNMLSKSNGFDQDWILESVVSGARVAATDTVQSFTTEDNEIFTIYPNPSSHQLQLVLPAGYEDSDIRVSNVSGMNLDMIVPFERIENKRIIDISKLQTGTYFISLQAKQKPIRVFRFVKK